MRPNRLNIRAAFLMMLLLFAIVPTLFPLSQMLVSGVGIITHPPLLADATVSQLAPDTNYGAYPNMWVRSSNDAGWKNARVFLEFDLSGIPQGSKIISATFSAYAYSPPTDSRTYGLYLLDDSWDESTITWNNRPLWPGQPIAVPEATVGTSADWVSWDVTDAIQVMLHRNTANAWANYGWEVLDETESSAGTSQHQTQFRTSEYSDATYWPKLDIVYYPPHLTLTPGATTMDAGHWISLTIDRKDYDNNPITNGQVTVSLTSTSSGGKFASSIGGTAITQTVILYGSPAKTIYYYDDEAGTTTLSVASVYYPTYVSNSKGITVRGGPPVKLTLAPPSTTIAAGGQFSSFTVTVLDAYDNTATVSSAIALTLATTSPGGRFRQVHTSTQITSVTVPAGSTTAQFDYYDIRGGTWTVTISSAGLISGTSQVTVIPDNTPPQTSLVIGNPKYVTAATTYVSASAQMQLTAIDTESGVKEVEYRVDGGGWSAYTSSFTLAAFSHGAHTIGFRSTDNADNQETEKTVTVFLDKNAPTVNLVSPTAGDLWVTSLSIRFEGTVTEGDSGLATITLMLDGTSQGDMIPGTTYSKTLTVTEGAHSWTISAVDNVGNVGQPTEISVNVRLDNTGPAITGIAIEPAAPVHGDSVVVSANIQDAGSGVQTANLKYSTDGTNWATVAMTLTSGTLFQGTIPGQNVFTSVSYYIQATDELANATTSPTATYQVQIPMLWLYAGGGVVLLLVLLIIARFLMRRPAAPAPSPAPPPPL
jgi:hypothetical protein